MKVLFIVADSVRADSLGCYNPQRSTPTIDALARTGARFATVYSSAPWTLPSLAAMLTGVWSHRLGLMKWEQPWPKQVPTLFDHFRAARHEIASFVFDPTHLFCHCPEAGVVGSSQDTEAMLEWFNQHRQQDYFAFVHYWWTHVPYLAKKMPLATWNMLCQEMIRLLAEPDPDTRAANREKLKGLYAHAISIFSEQWLPQLLDAARADMVVLTADHGESWGERMAPGHYPRDVFDLHGNHLHNEVINIPWLINVPGLVAPVVVSGPARSVDMLPTILELAGLARPAGELSGHSLVSALAAGAISPAQPAFFARNRDFIDQPVLPATVAEVFVEFGGVSGNRKVCRNIQTGDTRGYDLLADPAEQQPLKSDDREQELLAAVDGEIARATVAPHSEVDYHRMREHLTELGYI